MNSWQTTRKPKTQIFAGGKSTESPAAASCLQIVDVCLLGILFVAPLFLGGRHPMGRLLFVALACVAAIAWFLRQALLRQVPLNQASGTRSWAYLIAIAALFLVTVQLLPLPAGWIDRLAARNSSLLPLWAADANESVRLGTWSTLSLTPSSTKIALATLVAYVLLFVTAVGRLQTLTDVERLLRWIALAAILMAGFGLLQYFTSNGLFFWFYKQPFTTTDLVAKGSFSCRNHFAHFLALGMGPLFAWVVLRLQERKQGKSERQSMGNSLEVALYLGLILIVFAVLLSLSRGGAIALTVTSTLAVALYYRHGLISGSYLYGLAALGLLVVGMLSVYGYDTVANRLDDFASGSLDQLDSNHGRRRIWAANLAAIEQGGAFGAGVGSHREIYPVYLPESLNLEYTHAENGYLQIATESGYLGVSLLVLSLLTVGRWCWQATRRARSVRQLVAATAVFSALAASVVHSMVDFVWFIPACMSLTILLTSCALRLAQLTAGEEAQTQIHSPWSRLRWMGLAVAGSLASVWAVSAVVGPARASTHWDRYLLASQVQQKERTKQLFALEQSPEAETNHQSLTETTISNLRQVLAHDPYFARANLRLAGKYLQLFEVRQRKADNAMSIDQIRDAAMSSHFSSAEELRQWLHQAFGDNSELLYHAYHHTQKALQLCPLQGQGYLYLANLCFLRGDDRDSIDAYVTQSIKVRPHDGSILFKAGRQALLMGRVEEALDYWRQIFLDHGNHQLRIISLLAGRIPASAFLETFQPDWHSLPYVWRWYHHAGSPEDWQDVARYAENLAESVCPNYLPRRATRIWRSLATMQQTLEEHARAVTSLERALVVAPNEYIVHREYGLALLKVERYPQAESHLRWCLTRKPEDARLQLEIKKCGIRIAESRIKR